MRKTTLVLATLSLVWGFGAAYIMADHGIERVEGSHRCAVCGREAHWHRRNYLLQPYEVTGHAYGSGPEAERAATEDARRIFREKQQAYEEAEKMAAIFYCDEHKDKMSPILGPGLGMSFAMFILASLCYYLFWRAKKKRGLGFSRLAK